MKTIDEIENRIKEINKVLEGIIDIHTILKLKSERNSLMWVLGKLEDINEDYNCWKHKEEFARCFD